MTAIGIVRGKVDAAGRLYVRCGDGFREVQPTREPIVRLIPCRHCGKFFGCDCLDWLEWMLLAESEPQECVGDAA